MEIGVRDRRALDAASGAARELARGGRGASNDWRDVLEGHGEHVMQHECESLGRRQCFKDDQPCEAHRISRQRFVLWLAPAFRTDNRLWHVNAKRILPT